MHAALSAGDESGQLSLAAAAADVAAVQWHYASRGLSLASAALAGARQYREWVHHPHNDLVDERSGASYFYHAHAAAERAADEHGHFHISVAAPPGCVPAFVHLIGISLDARGLPTRLFTTNRWVTGEHWLPAGALAQQLPDFALQARGRLAPVARWVQGMVRLYADLITELLYERDTLLLARDACGPAEPTLAALDDQHLHITSQHPVALLERLASVSATNTATPALPAPNSV
jgi:hypothetical protein